MAKQITITYYGMEGSGPTVREAKADASTKLERLIRELQNANPVIVRVGEWTALVAFDINGWGYRIIQAPVTDSSNVVGPVYLNHGYGDKHETRKAALRHLTECAWRIDFPYEGGDEGFVNRALSGISSGSSISNGAPLNHTEQAQMKNELLRRFSFQRTYQQAKLDGYSDNAAHYIAGGLKRLVDNGTVN